MLQQSGHVSTQNQFYNGSLYDPSFCSNIFAFPSNGRIIAYALSAPGCLHDSTSAGYGHVYMKLRDAYERINGQCAVDSEFYRAAHLFFNKRAHRSCTPPELRIERDATSARQSTEWGMRALQGSFTRIKDIMVFEKRGESWFEILCTVYLFNFKMSLVALTNY